MRHIASRPVARGATRQSGVREDARVLFPLDLMAPMTNRPRPYRSPGRLYCNRLPLREAFMRMGASRRMGYSRESGNPELLLFPGFRVKPGMTNCSRQRGRVYLYLWLKADR